MELEPCHNSFDLNETSALSMDLGIKMHHWMVLDWYRRRTSPISSKEFTKTNFTSICGVMKHMGNKESIPLSVHQPFETDCKDVITIIKKPEKYLSNFSMELQKFFRLRSRFTYLRFNFLYYLCIQPEGSTLSLSCYIFS